MDKLKYNQSIQHFSHPHPLDLSNLQQQQPNINLPPCAMCELEPSGSIYICKTCNFILHISCSQKPQLINHPSDNDHPLTLLPFPAYPDGTFTCDACGLEDKGFSYHCRACTLDLHIHCASKPISLNHQAHPHTLCLSVLRRNTPFTCDMCRGEVAVNQWSYECRACDFDAHLSCASMPMSLNHQAHPHTLHFSVFRRQTSLSCAMCRREIAVNQCSYECKACDFGAHLSCASMPMSLNHQAHPHSLGLSIGRQTSCTCDMCCEDVAVNQWSYECRECDFDAHLSCASNPHAQASCMGGGSSGATSLYIQRLNAQLRAQAMINLGAAIRNASKFK